MAPAADSRPLRLLALAAVVSCLAAGLAILWTLSWNRSFQVDEVEHVHAAYNVRTGKLLYEDFHQAHNPLLYVALLPFVDPDEPVASFRRARGFTTALLVLNVALCAYCAWRLTHIPGALLAGGLALWQSTLLERGMEVRTDGPTSLCVTAALAVELTPLPRLRKYGLEALLLAFAFLLTNKAAFACFAFGCLWLAAAVRERRPALVAVPMTVWCLPLAAAAAVMAALGNFEEFFRVNVLEATGHVVGRVPRSESYDNLAIASLVVEGRRNVAFFVLAAAGFLVSLARLRGSSDDRGSGLGFVLFLAGVLFLSLLLNPFPFPYLQVTALPAFVVLAAVAGSWLVERLRFEPAGAGGLAVVLVLVAAAAATSGPHLIGRMVAPELERQFATLRELERVTGPDDAVFDMTGLYFRPDGARFYMMTGQTLVRYQRGEAGGMPRIPGELRERQVVAIVMNYRIQWLEGEERTFLRSHYAHYDGNVFLQGRYLGDLAPGDGVELEVLKDKEFRFDGDGAILVDGREFRQGFLPRGRHRITRTAGHGPARLIMATPPPIPWPPRPPQQLFESF